MTEVRRFPVSGAGVGREDYSSPVMGPNAKEMRTERRSTSSNDNGVVAPAAPPAFYTMEIFKGKFYTRGCRGMLEQLQIYCRRDAGVGVLTLYYSPHPCIGPFGQVTITPGANWAWVAADIEEMWNYDSLFIWVRACHANVSWAYDTALPFDGHESDDLGVTWSDMAIRPFIRAVFTGETAGDVPVSGILNVIRIPSTALEAAFGQVNIQSGVWTDATFAIGAGELIQVQVEFVSAVVPAAGVEYRVRIQADGLAGIEVGNRQITQSVIATAGRCAIGEFFQDATSTWLWVRLPIQYRRRLLAVAYQSTGGPVVVRATIVSNELR